VAGDRACDGDDRLPRLPARDGEPAARPHVASGLPPRPDAHDPPARVHGFAAGVLHIDAHALSEIGWFVTIGRTALPHGFLLAIALASPFAGGVLKRLIGEIGGSPSAPRLREVVAGGSTIHPSSSRSVSTAATVRGFARRAGRVGAGLRRARDEPRRPAGRDGGGDVARSGAEHRPGARAGGESGDTARAGAVASGPSSRRRPPSSRRPARTASTRATRSGAGSSAICTTARSTSWSPPDQADAGARTRAIPRSPRGSPTLATGSRTSSTAARARTRRPPAAARLRAARGACLRGAALQPPRR
jgi:hypothetical protein